jgi:hypothetical protein
MIACLRAVMNKDLIAKDPQICDNPANLGFAFKPLTLTSNVIVEYDIGDKWFILTIVFACLDFLAIIFAVLFIKFYRKSKNEHFEFRKRKENWLQYDNAY